MPLIRTSSQYSFKPIPENDVAQNYHGLNQQTNALTTSTDTNTNSNHQPPPDPGKPPRSHTTTTPSTQDASVEELRKLVSDLQSGEGGGGGGGAGGWIVTGEGSRPSSRSSLRSLSRQGSRYSSRRNSWVMTDEEDEEEAEVSGSQKAHLLVVSQQRLVYTLQGLRHELTSLDEEVNRIRNDVLNSRRFFNAMRGIPDQPYWGSGGRRTVGLCGSDTNSPLIFSSLDNSYSDDMHSIATSESCSSFASWRSESELYGVFREAEDAAVSDLGSNKSSEAGNVNDCCSSSNNSSGSTNPSSFGAKDTEFSGPAFSKMRGRYRQLGTPNPRA